MITHRCEGSVVLYHAEYGKPKMSRVIGIKYCPFCGEKLEVRDETSESHTTAD